MSDNTAMMMARRPKHYINPRFDAMVDSLRTSLESAGISPDRVCIIGSAPLDIVGCRPSADLDFIVDGDLPSGIVWGGMISHDESSLSMYPCTKHDIIYDERFHFRYRGMKVITLDVLDGFKANRNHRPKDSEDRLLIRSVLMRTSYSRWLDLDYVWLRTRRWLFSKERVDGGKVLCLFGCVRIFRKKRLHISS